MSSRPNTVQPIPFPSQSYATGTWFGATAAQQKPTTDAASRKWARNDAWAGLLVIIDITNHNGGSLTLKLQAYAPAAAKFVDVPSAATAALSGSNQTVTLLIFPGTIETANVRISQCLPPLYQLVATVATAAVTFSAEAWELGY
jgi:hypothetical protein